MSTYIQSVDATDPKEITVSRGVLRELIRLARNCQNAADHSEVPAFLKAFGVGDAEMVDYLEETFGLKQAAADLRFLHDYLYHSGANKNRLGASRHLEAMTLCDGYGQMNGCDLKEKDLTWDWSHVRDSTPDALAEARAYIEGVLLLKVGEAT
jgi:hypothetical protein